MCALWRETGLGGRIVGDGAGKANMGFDHIGQGQRVKNYMTNECEGRG